MSRAANAIRLFIAVIVAGLAISCVAVSPPGEVVSLSVSQAQKNATQSSPVGPVRWGGTIVEVYNKPGITVLEIVSRPLMHSGRPKHNDTTDGRFLAEIDEFLDPEIIKTGRDISVIGLVGEVQVGKIGEANYTYPVVSVSNYRFWKELTELAPSSGYPYYFSDDRFWYGWPYRIRSGIRVQAVF